VFFLFFSSITICKQTQVFTGDPKNLWNLGDLCEVKNPREIPWWSFKIVKIVSKSSKSAGFSRLG